MPMYDFICTACGTKFEELVHDTAAPVCPLCGSSGTERQMSAPSPLKTGAFPYKPGPVRPLGKGLPSCGGNGCGSSAGPQGGFS